MKATITVRLGEHGIAALNAVGPLLLEKYDSPSLNAFLAELILEKVREFRDELPPETRIGLLFQEQRTGRKFRE